jgi:hypothetical protein
MGMRIENINKNRCSSKYERRSSDCGGKESSRTNLKTVTDPEHGHAEIEHGRVDPGSVFVVYRVRRSGEDDTCESQRWVVRIRGERDGGVDVR